MCDLAVCMASEDAQRPSQGGCQQKINQKPTPYSAPLTSSGNSSSESEPSAVVLVAVGIIVASSEAAGATLRLFTLCITS